MNRIRLNQFSNAGFQRGAPVWKEALWWMVRRVFFLTWLPWPSRLKVVLLRLFGAKVGQGVVLRGRVNITFPWRFECGDYVWIGDDVLILTLGHVRLGSHICISQRAFLCTGSHDHRKETFDLITRPIQIGDGCWVGAQCFLGPGVALGSGVVCAAGAVVTKSVGPDSVIGGNPARLISKSGASDSAEKTPADSE